MHVPLGVTAVLTTKYTKHTKAILSMRFSRHAFPFGLTVCIWSASVLSAEFKPRAVFYTSTGERTITPIEVTARPDKGWIANFEPRMKDRTSILTAVFTPGDAALQTTDEGDLLLVRKVKDGERFVWWAGQAWTGRGEVLDARQWAECVAREQDAALHPISVELH